MDFNKLLEGKKISKYKLSKESGVPYSTICDISTGKSVLLKCSAETVIRIAHVLNMKVEDLVGEIAYPENEKSTPKKKAKTEKVKSDKKTEDKKKDKTAKTGKKEKQIVEENKITKTSNNDRKVREEKSLPNDPIKKGYLDRKKEREEAYKYYCEDLQNKIKEMGELNFLVSYLKNNEVSILFNLNRKKESKYLLALVDDLCVKYNFPLCKEYDEIREYNE